MSNEESANSSIKYGILERAPPTPGRGLSLEYQIGDPNKPLEANRHRAALFDLIPAEDAAMRRLQRGSHR